MHSTLIRFTDKKYVDSYLKGELYLSSLSAFWDLTKDKIPYSNSMTKEEIANFIRNTPSDRQDFSEGVVAQIPRNQVGVFLRPMKDYIIHDVRFRLSAYKYCNLLCFFRIDAEDADHGLLDEDNIAYLLKNQGKNITAEDIRSMEKKEVLSLARRVSKKNLLLDPNRNPSVQLPTVEMDSFGDAVIVIKDQQEFENRVMAAVKRMGGTCSAWRYSIPSNAG